jgi:hypothetical protein
VERHEIRPIAACRAGVTAKPYGVRTDLTAKKWGKAGGLYPKRAADVNARLAATEMRGAFRTLRLARDFVEMGFGFWLVGGSLWKSGEVRQWNAV